ncbi:MAG: DNA polymerase III subunit delta', partial [Verrucomicrobia bacterium]
MAFSHTAALEYLRRAYEQNRLAHAYLISGSPGSGKRLLAAELASLVNGTKPGDVFSASAREISVAEPESKSRRIVIEQVRALEHALQMRATAGRRKVAIIAEADRLQPHAANAFLKTLEEPPKDSLLLLLSALPEALPDTIISRCIAIPLA